MSKARELSLPIADPAIRARLSQAVGAFSEVIAEKILKLEGFDVVRLVFESTHGKIRAFACKNCNRYLQGSFISYIGNPSFCERCGSKLVEVEPRDYRYVSMSKDGFFLSPKDPGAVRLLGLGGAKFLEELGTFLETENRKRLGKPDRGSVPDLMARKRNQTYVIEVKSGMARLTPNQRKVLSMAEKRGLKSLVMRMDVNVRIQGARLEPFRI